LDFPNHLEDQQNLTELLKRPGKGLTLPCLHNEAENGPGRPEYRLSEENRKAPMQTGLKPVWAGRNMRLDPFRLPQMVSYASREDHGDVTLTVDHRGAVLRRTLEMSGLPAVIALPSNVFRGVAARALEDADGHVTVTLELLHDDPMLSVPLLVAHDLDDVAADWRAWSEAYRLPMLLIEADGVARTLEESLGAAIKTMPPQERRQGRAPARRRPRFLARRRTGNLGLRLVIDGEEIIART
jgi:hypothetical protein